MPSYYWLMKVCAVGKYSNSFNLGWEDSKLCVLPGLPGSSKKITDLFLRAVTCLTMHMSGSLPCLISLSQMKFYLNPYVVVCFWEKFRLRHHSRLYLLMERSAYWVYQLTVIGRETLWVFWIIFRFLERVPHSIPWGKSHQIINTLRTDTLESHAFWDVWEGSKCLGKC